MQCQKYLLPKIHIKTIYITKQDNLRICIIPSNYRQKTPRSKSPSQIPQSNPPVKIPRFKIPSDLFSSWNPILMLSQYFLTLIPIKIKKIFCDQFISPFRPLYCQKLVNKLPKTGWKLISEMLSYFYRNQCQKYFDNIKIGLQLENWFWGGFWPGPGDLDRNCKGKILHYWIRFFKL